MSPGTYVAPPDPSARRGVFRDEPRAGSGISPGLRANRNKVSDKTRRKLASEGKAPGAVRPAYALAMAAIVLSWLVAWFAYQSSQEQILDTIYRSNLNLARTLAAAAGDAAAPRRADTVKAVEKLWHNTEQRFAGSYLCVLPPDGTLLLHTARPEWVGAQRGGAVIETDWPHGPRTPRELAAVQRDWTGRFTNLAGREQVAAFAYAPALDALVAIHIPASTWTPKSMPRQDLGRSAWQSSHSYCCPPRSLCSG